MCAVRVEGSGVSVRRVRLDEDDAAPAYTAPPDPGDLEDEAREDDKWLEHELSEEEREAFEAMKLHERSERQEPGDHRGFAAISPDPYKKPPERLSEAQALRPPRAVPPEFIADYGEAFIPDDKEAAKDIGRKLSDKKKWREGQGHRWLGRNDPRRSVAGVEAELRNLASKDGLTLEACRQAFRKGGGKPTAAHREHRERVRQVVAQLWETDCPRGHLAAALGCSAPALRGLMKCPGGTKPFNSPY